MYDIMRAKIGKINFVSKNKGIVTEHFLVVIGLALLTVAL